jgi:hypothetical protein
MSAAAPTMPTAPTVPTSPSPALTAAEFIRSLPEAFKASLLSELIREIAQQNRNSGVIPLRSPAEEWLGNLVLPGEPAAKADRDYFEFDAETRQMIMKAYLDLDLDDILSDEEMEAIAKGDWRPKSQ